MYRPDEFTDILRQYPELMMTLDLGHANIRAPQRPDGRFYKDGRGTDRPSARLRQQWQGRRAPSRRGRPYRSCRRDCSHQGVRIRFHDDPRGVFPGQELPGGIPGEKMRPDVATGIGRHAGRGGLKRAARSMKKIDGVLPNIRLRINPKNRRRGYTYDRRRMFKIKKGVSSMYTRLILVNFGRERGPTGQMVIGHVCPDLQDHEGIQKRNILCQSRHRRMRRVEPVGTKEDAETATVSLWPKLQESGPAACSRGLPWSGPSNSMSPRSRYTKRKSREGPP